MILSSRKIRIALAAALVVLTAGSVCAQQTFNPQQTFAAPGPSFDPYAVYQQPSGEIIPGAVLPPAETVVVEQPLPVFPARYPVRFVLFGEYLYMRGSDAAMTSYAVPVNGAVVPPPTPAIPMGPVAAIEHDFRSGFRIGFDWVWNDYSAWVTTYSQLDLKASDGFSVDPAAPLAIQSLVLHPSTAAADTLFLDAAANGRLKTRLADLEYRRIFVEDWYRWDFLAGMRYGQLEQDFSSMFSNSTTTETVDARSKFDGGGIRFGTRGDWRSANHGFFLYAQATTSFLAGRFSSRYMQSDSFLGTVVNTSRKDDRIINVTDAELGVGWHSRTHRWWFSGGYMFSTWDDVVNTAGLIRAVQTNNYFPIRERLTFDGLAARAELRF